MEEVEQWLDNAVTQKYFEALAKKQAILSIENAEVLDDDPTELFRRKWEYQGRLEELGEILDLALKDPMARADAIEDLFGGEDDE